jgi:hypothetical protein
LYGAFVTVTCEPLCAATPFQRLLIVWPAENVQPTDQRLIVAAPVFFTVTAPWKPPCHEPVTASVAVQPAGPDVGTEVGVAVGFGVGVCVGGVPSVVTEKLFRVRPAPPTHGSKPAWMLVRYQLVEPRPRLTTSFQKSFTRKLAEPVVCCRT